MELSRVLKCSISCWVYRQNLGYLKKHECSFSGKSFGYSQMITVQEEGKIEVLAGYSDLRCGKVND
jgi:hypothetical protein